MKHFKKIKHKKGAWFVALRGSYIPVSREGWLTYIPYLILLFLPPVILVAADYRLCLKTVVLLLVYYFLVVAGMTKLAKSKS